MDITQFNIDLRTYKEIP